MKSIYLLLVVVTLAALPSLAQGTTDTNPADNACPDTHPWTGKIQNYSYQFAFVIPERLEGFWNSARCVADEKYGCVCMSDHGRIIPLSSAPHDPERHIEVYGGYAMGEDEDAVTTTIRWIKERGTHLSIKKRSKVLLGGMKADRVVVRYLDNKRNIWMIEDFIEATNNRYDFSLYLRTPEVHYPADRPLLESVVASFALTPEKEADEKK